VLEARRAADASGERAAAARGRAQRARVVLWQALGGSELP
jgi:outer membrane protein TolC